MLIPQIKPLISTCSTFIGCLKLGEKTTQPNNFQMHLISQCTCIYFSSFIILFLPWHFNMLEFEYISFVLHVNTSAKRSELTAVTAACTQLWWIREDLRWKKEIKPTKKRRCQMTFWEWWDKQQSAVLLCALNHTNSPSSTCPSSRS